MKIAWAFEPSGINKKQLTAMNSLIQTMAGSGASTELIHVESEIYPGMVAPYGAVLPYVNKRDVRGDIRKALKQSGISISASHQHLIDAPVFSLSNSVDQTLKAAASEGCDTVALFNHGKKGVERLLLGSFAETMIHRSKLDLLLMNPSARWSGAVKKVLFLDDFSKESRTHLSKVIEFCRAKKAELVVFHYPHLTYSWSFQEENPIVRRYRQDVDRRKRTTEKVCREAGVSAEVVVQGGMSTIADAAFKLQRKKGADLIVVAAKMGRIGALLGGSITRQIVRESHVPVLILKSPQRRSRKSNSRPRSYRQDAAVLHSSAR